jgi:formate dehydrogenase subunit delta
MMQADKLVRMVNQISSFFVTQPGNPAAAVADHLLKFWEPRMRNALIEHDRLTGGEGLVDAARAALPLLKAHHDHD